MSKFAIKLESKKIMVSWNEFVSAYVRTHKSRIYRMATFRLATLWDSREEAEAFLLKVSLSSQPVIVEIAA